MESLLDTLNQLDGVRGVFVASTKGQCLVCRTHHIYDRELLEEVGRQLTTTIESVQLHHQDWETFVATFAEGKLVVRNLGKAVLALVADTKLNMSFATVALRVTTVKLRDALKRGELDVNTPRAAPPPAPSIIKLAALDSSQITVTSSPSVGSVWTCSPVKGVLLSVAVADDTCSAFLETCADALARAVGPLSWVFVRDAVRKICGPAPFATKDARRLMAELEKRILDREDRIAFRKTVAG